MRHTGRYKGTEKLLLNGKELPYSMLDFWSINLSEILLNMTRGSFAEFLVQCALTEGGFNALGDDAVKTGVEAYDIDGPKIMTPQGKRPSRIEVKSAASIQVDTPDERNRSRFRQAGWCSASVLPLIGRPVQRKRKGITTFMCLRIIKQPENPTICLTCLSGIFTFIPRSRSMRTSTQAFLTRKRSLCAVCR